MTESTEFDGEEMFNLYAEMQTVFNTFKEYGNHTGSFELTDVRKVRHPITKEKGINFITKGNGTITDLPMPITQCPHTANALNKVVGMATIKMMFNKLSTKQG